MIMHVIQKPLKPNKNSLNQTIITHNKLVLKSKPRV